MDETEKPPTRKISSFLFAMILITLALSISALYQAIDAYRHQDTAAVSYFMIIGFAGLALSTYMLFQTRRKMPRLTFKMQPVVTTILCGKCGFKNIRDFQRGDYIFKEAETCPKCNEKMMIASIYREVKEKEREERLS